jgi:hypothetical protein
MRRKACPPILALVMKGTGNGGTMDAIYTAPLTQRRSTTTPIRTAVAAVGSIVLDVLRTSARGDDFDRTFSSAPGAQFAALPRGSRQRHLDRGQRP